MKNTTQLNTKRTCPKAKSGKFGYDSSLASGDNFGTNSLDPDQARKSVELNWIHTV